MVHMKKIKYNIIRHVNKDESLRDIAVLNPETDVLLSLLIDTEFSRHMSIIANFVTITL